MFQIRISKRRRLRAGSSLRRAATVLSLLVLCLIPRDQAFSQESREKERERRILQIQQLFGQGDLAEARRLLNEAMKQFPADAGLDNLLGIIEAQEGNYAAAERSFNQAVARDRKFTGAYLNLGRLYQEHATEDPQALPKALEVYSRALQYEPDNAEANYQSAALLMRKGAYQASLDHLSRLPATIQNSAQALSVSCADYAGLGRGERANESAERLLAHPDFSEPDVSAALPALTGNRRDDLSVELLEGLRKRQPLSPALARHLGLAYEQTGKLPEARAALETSVGGDPPSAALLVDLARVAHKQRDYKGALGYLAHARDLEPNNAGLSYFFGLVCLDLSLVAEARAAFDSAVKLEPENPAYNYAMGATSAFRRDPSEAIPYFEKYIRLRPQDARGKLALGAALFRAKQYDAAARALTEAVKFPDTATTARYYLGSVAREEGRLDEAVQELQQALKADPDYTDALAELGHCYLMKKEYEPAGKLLRRALEIDPNHYAANFNLLTLYARAKDGREAAQAARFEEVKKLREEKAQEFLRMVEARPYPVP
ncbi:MAG TPA: tetratricopeptide repeat protein [Blastocatellia bacterium]|jgi:tetratricopeptide (TPR) repeat protein